MNLNDAPTVLNHEGAPDNQRSTAQAVRDILGRPEDEFALPTSLTFEQRIMLSQVKLAEGIDIIRRHGCSQRSRHERRFVVLERYVTWAKGGIAVLGGAGVLVGFIFLVIEFVRRHGG